jgi:hypothetical protein
VVKGSQNAAECVHLIVLQVKANFAMLGCLNVPEPFTEDTCFLTT